ncbi:MAG: YggT family protein [Proteobacteria bacterium]|nr:YggT family protein [Pseudomonadota bacterium]
MDIILIPLLAVISSVIGIYVWIVITSVIVSWLVSFNVINSNNNFVIMIIEFLYRVTEPVLSKIRRFLPVMGGLDLSPLVLILFLWFIQSVIGQLMLRIVMVRGA